MNIPSQFLKMVLFHARKTISPFFCLSGKDLFSSCCPISGLSLHAFFASILRESRANVREKEGLSSSPDFFLCKKGPHLGCRECPPQTRIFGKGGGRHAAEKRGRETVVRGRKNRKNRGKSVSVLAEKKMQWLEIPGFFF